MLAQLATALALSSFVVATAAPLQHGAVELTGEVTYVDSTAFPSGAVQVGGLASVRVRLDLSIPPVNAGFNSLNYRTIPTGSRIQLDDRQILVPTPSIQTNLLVVDGQGVLPDAMTFEQSAHNPFGSSFTDGRAFLFVDGQSSSVWSSPDLTTFPAYLALGAPGGPRATLSVYNDSNVEVATAVFSALEVDVSGEVGCVNCVNSTGLPGRLRGQGSREVADNSFSLFVDHLPQDSFGYFIVSPNEGYVVHPGLNMGALCLSSPIGRFIAPGQLLNSGPSGSVTLPIDLTRVPSLLSFESIAPGDTRYFQFWHRDVAPNGPFTTFTESAVITFE